MSYDTKRLLTDERQTPVAQYYNPLTDTFEVLRGSAGGSRVLLYDANGNALLTTSNPGYMAITDGSHSLVINADGSIKMQVTRAVAAEPFAGTVDHTHNFTQTMKEFVISNDGALDLTFTIQGNTYTVKTGEVSDEAYGDFTSVSISTTVAYRAYARR